MLNLNIYCMFHLAADIPINALLSKAEMVLLFFVVLEKIEKTLYAQISRKHNLSGTEQED